MMMGDFSSLEWLVLVERELMVFAGVFFLIGSIDELMIDAVYGWLKLSGRAETRTIARGHWQQAPLQGPAALFIPTWRESAVIGATIAHALAAWRQQALRVYVGCYANDPETMAAVMAASAGDPRLRLVVLDRAGPTTKADCLNRLYAALRVDEQRAGCRTRMVLLHDAEDMVDPAALALLDRQLDSAEFVQLPVLPEPQRGSPFVAGHYCEEFAEQHGKTLVVRDALGAAIPAAGVGCAFSREMLARIARANGAGQAPFSVESLTEDYELGLRVKAYGGRSRFLRLRGDDGQLVATRACFPPTLGQAVRQKTRWIHGIALQSWDRIGWTAHPIESWMRLRDRRGPLTALVLAAAYLLFALAGLAWALGPAVPPRRWEMEPLLQLLLLANLIGFGWRAAWRFGFTAREYGPGEALLALVRIPLANLIAITAGRRALSAYVGTLFGQPPRWDKTEHKAHPALMGGTRVRPREDARA